jgi:hypothetical protein
MADVRFEPAAWPPPIRRRNCRCARATAAQCRSGHLPMLAEWLKPTHRGHRCRFRHFLKADIASAKLKVANVTAVITKSFKPSIAPQSKLAHP